MPLIRGVPTLQLMAILVGASAIIFFGLSWEPISYSVNVAIAAPGKNVFDYITSPEARQAHYLMYAVEDGDRWRAGKFCFTNYTVYERVPLLWGLLNFPSSARVTQKLICSPKLDETRMNQHADGGIFELTQKFYVDQVSAAPLTNFTMEATVEAPRVVAHLVYAIAKKAHHWQMNHIKDVLEKKA